MRRTCEKTVNWQMNWKARAKTFLFRSLCKRKAQISNSNFQVSSFLCRLKPLVVVVVVCLLVDAIERKRKKKTKAKTHNLDSLSLGASPRRYAKQQC